MPATPRNDLYERLVDRLRHAAQYAEAARAAVEEVRSARRAEREVVAMMAGPDEWVEDRLLRAEQYGESTERAVQDALELLEGARKEADDA